MNGKAVEKACVVFPSTVWKQLKNKHPSPAPAQKRENGIFK